MSSYEISKSSLLSLKAEILRKQQELVKAKADNEVKIKIIKKNAPLEIKNKGIEQRQQNDVEEDEDILKQSRSILEAKTKLYEKLSSGYITDEQRELNKRYLVRFDKKKSSVPDLPPHDSEDSPDKYPESDEDRYQSDNEVEKDPGEKWVDYVDCLGRTRKCLQKDLEYLKEKDEDLKKTVEAKKKNEQVNEKLESFEKIGKNNNEGITKESQIDKEQSKVADESELLSNDMRREMLRRQWEEEEEELRNKSNIHYQDILFGEARTHGVGYYGFSKDEEERAKQQEALKKLRIETEQKQKRAQELKAMREKQLAARIKAAKDRKRARLGLPPEEEIVEMPVEPEISEEEKKKQEELKQKEVEKEKMLEEARKRHVRPWDIGKEGVKEHYEMTQEEWIDKKREERPEEFAPPSLYRTEFRSIVKDIEVEDTDKTLNFTTKKPKKKQRKRGNWSKLEKSVNPYKPSSLGLQNKDNIEEVNINESRVEDNTDDYFQETDHSVSFKPNPIVNLCEETDFHDQLLSEYKKTMQNVSDGLSDSSDSVDDRSKRRGVEIAPPPTFDYYGPTHSKRPKNTPVVSNIEASIEAGLKFLRTQVEKKEKSSKHDRDMYLS